MNEEELHKENTEPAEQKKGKKNKPKKSVGQEILEWVLTIVAALAIAFVIRSFVFEPVKVDGASMNDTLVDGEVMLVTKFEYSTADIPFIGKIEIGTPKRFDVIICHYPDRTSTGFLGIVTETNFVKRLIGMPGDTIKLENGYVYIKEAGAEDYVRYDEPYVSDEYRDGGLNTSLASAMRYSSTTNSKYILNADGSFTVPEGCYFVMGDHRNNSNDSRCIGPITRDQIVGKVAQVVWPLSSFRSIPNGLDVQ